MQLNIISASGSVLQAPSFEKITLMTEMGEITVLPGHEPILSAIRPGIISISYRDTTDTLSSAEYASGGGVLNISPESITIVADVIEKGDGLTDMEYIESQKKEAEELMRAYKEENGTIIDPKRLLDLEYELLKYTAMHQLGQKYQSPTSGRR